MVVGAGLDLIEEGLTPLTAAPGLDPAFGVNRLVLRRFPYDLVIVEENSGYVVIAVAHHSRQPGYWRDRLKR